MGLFDRLFGKKAERVVQLRQGDLERYRSLSRGEGLQSADGRIALILSHEGILSLESAGRTLWKPATSRPAIRFLLDSHGHLLLISEEETCWSADISGGTRLAVQDDGNLVLYDGPRPIWHSDTRA